MSDVPLAVGVVELLLGTASVLVGLGMLFVGRRNLPALLLSVLPLGFGQHLVLTALSALALEPPTFLTVRYLGPVSTAAVIAFVILYPGMRLTATKKVLLVLAVLTVPLKVWSLSANGDWMVGLRAPPDYRLMIAEWILAVAVLGWRWLRQDPGPYRIRIAWALTPFFFWLVHDGLDFVVLPALLGSTPFEHPPGLRWLLFFGFLLSLLLAGITLVRLLRGEQGGDLKALTFITLYTVPLVIGEHALMAGRALSTHALFDTLSVVFLAYGVARYNVLDLDRRVRWGVERGTVAAGFVAAFFIASEGAAAFFESTTGSTLFGILAAALLVFALAPLERVARRFAMAALPSRFGADAHSGRAYELYIAAAEAAQKDGTVTSMERDVLARLQDELGISAQEAVRLERLALESVPR